MPGAFEVKPATETVKLDAKRHAEVSFTVFNRSGGAITGRAEVQPEPPAQQSWFSPPTTLQLAPDESGPVTVKIDVPESVPEGTCKFRLNVISPSKRTGEDESSEGPLVTVQVGPLPKPEPTGFPWQLVAAAALVLLIGGVAAWWLWPRTLPGLGAECTPPNGKCATDLACTTIEIQEDGSFRTVGRCLGATNAPCTVSINCASNFCRQQLCSPCGSPGDCPNGPCRDGACMRDTTLASCQSDADCGSTQQCDVQGTKVCLRKEGQSCKQPIECMTLACAGDHCARLANGAACKADVSCQSGRCDDGKCSATVVSCVGVACPPGQFCIGGRCLRPHPPIAIDPTRRAEVRNRELKVIPGLPLPLR